MSRLNEREIARRLAEPLDDGPPEGLLDKIKAEIPPVIPVGTQNPMGNVRPFPSLNEDAPPRRQRWLIAASIAMMMIGGLLAWRVFQMRPMEEMEAEEPSLESQAAAPQDVPQDFDRDAAAPPPAAVMPRPRAESDSAAKEERSEGSDLEALGYAGAIPPPPPAPQARRQDPTEPMQPVEVPESFAEEISVAGEAPLLDKRRISTGAAAAPKPQSGVEVGVEGGVEGGVVGGVAGGVVGGVPGGVFNESIVANDHPLRVGRGTTGGNAEPNDEPYGDNFFESAGTNPFIDTEEDRRSTFGLDVDTASYTVARRYLEDGNLPKPDSVRVEEFLNFFDYGDEPPAQGDFAIRAEGAPTPFAPGNHRVLRFNIRGRQIRPEERKPAVLTFVVDVSGSMDMENRIGLVKQSLGLLIDQLRPADKVGLVIYGSEARTVLEPTHDLKRVRAAVDGLRIDGATNAEAGLVMAYDLANRFFRPEANNRLILCSDGVANVGNTGPKSILERIGKEARKGIELTTLGFGMGNLNDHLMEQLANQGDGRYAYLDTLDEARRVLVEELEGTLETIAKDAKVQVVFNPEVVERWRLLGYENRDIDDDRFRDDTVDAGEIGAGHSVTALYEIKLKAGSQGHKPVANLHLRWRSEAAGKVREEEKLIRLSQFAPSWDKATPGLRLASVVAEFAEILRGSYWARGSSLMNLSQRAQKLSGELAGTRRAADVNELVSLIVKAAQIKR